ncbi:MAG: hypothetical protein MJZ05_12380 [Fibrobacter sp.]|nr:hypothetical protein [Fibrobacter sp.]
MMKDWCKTVGVFVMVFVCASFAQLALPKKAVEDSVKINESKPLVVIRDSNDIDLQALDDSISVINAEPTLQETAKNVVIQKGIELIGTTLKNSLSPNSAETDAVLQELEYK